MSRTDSSVHDRPRRWRLLVAVVSAAAAVVVGVPTVASAAAVPVHFDDDGVILFTRPVRNESGDIF